jgi:hypothetical protein
MGFSRFTSTRRFVSGLIPLALVVSFASCRQSQDNSSRPGAGLGPEVRLAVSGTDSRGLSLAASGNLVVAVWAATAKDATNIYAAVSQDRGNSFSAPVRVNDIEGDARVNGEQPPRVAIGRDVTVVWQSRQSGESQVRLARSTDNGRTFQAASTAHPQKLTGARGWASVAADNSGALHLAWLDGRNAAPKPPAAAPAAAAPAAGAAPAAHVHSGPPMRQDIMHAVWRPDGSSAEALVASYVCFCCKTSVATGPDGSTYVAFRNIYPTNLRDIAVARSVDGVTFAEPVRVSEDGWQLDGCPEDGPSIGVGADGVVHVAWPTIAGKDGLRKGIYYSYSTDGGQSFAPRVRMDDAADVQHSAHPQLVIAGKDVAVTWDERGNAGPRIRVRLVHSVEPANAWRPQLGPVSTVSDSGPVNHATVASAEDVIISGWTVNTPTSSEVWIRRVPITERR